MEDTGIFGISSSTMAVLLIVVFLIAWSAYTWYYGGVTVPLPSYAIGFRSGSTQGFRNSTQGFRNSTQGFLGSLTQDVPQLVKKDKEGFRNVENFGGVAHGAGSPSCLRSSAEGAQLVDMFQSKEARFDEGPDSLRELTVLIGKLCCFKKDLVSPSYTVNATRMQQYSTTHDIEPIAETTARCFAKTISPRDLTISLDKWNSRGEVLINKLCTAYSLTPDEVNTAEGLFRYVVRDVSDIARSSCLQGEPIIAGAAGPRDAHPYEKSTEFGTYTGYY
jgi:hypothetical protein